MPENQNGLHSSSEFDHESNPDFFDYYERESTSEETLARFRRTHDKLLGLAERNGIPTNRLEVLDIGCGAGTQCQLWAEEGHRVRGLDVNGPLIELARERARRAGLSIEFELGTATDLPYADCSMNVCLLPELLEHVVDWQACVDEAVRVLRPDGLLYLSTTNRLCPIQQEFNLPGYSWYPAFIKRKFVHLAVTTRPEPRKPCQVSCRPLVYQRPAFGILVCPRHGVLRSICNDRRVEADTDSAASPGDCPLDCTSAIPWVRPDPCHNTICYQT